MRENPELSPWWVLLAMLLVWGLVVLAVYSWMER